MAKREKKLVGKFNKDLTKIEFYEIVDNYKHYTILRKQGTKKHFAWDNETSMLSGDLHMIAIPDNKTLYKRIIEHIQTWCYGDVFFWADSKFVTEYGLPHYHMLVEIYKQMLSIKDSEVDLLRALIDAEENADFITYMKCKWQINRLFKQQNKVVKRMVKEFKLIW